MRVVLTAWLLMGALSLSACGAPSPLPQRADVPQTAQPTAIPAEATSPVPPAPVSPLPTPIVEANPAGTTPASPLPTPAVLGATTASPAQTPIIAPPEAEGQAPGKLPQAIGEAVIIYQRSGGFVGVSEQWTIYSDGRITTGDGREWQVTPQQVEQVLHNVEALGFFEMSGRYMSRTVCCDRFTYEITVRREGKVNTVTTIDAEPDAPPQLWQVIDEINRLVSGAQTG